MLVRDVHSANAESPIYITEAGVDFIQGLYPETLGIVQRPGGITKLQQINQERILAIHQTFNTTESILIQTDSNLYSMSLDEFMGRSFNTSLVATPDDIEEDMSYAIIVDQYPVGNGSGTATTAGSWITAPLNAVAQQLEPNGTAATFASVASNQISLAAGTYRIRGWCIMYSNAESSFKLKLYNASTSADLFGADTNAVLRGATIHADRNAMGHFGGQITLGATTLIELRAWVTSAHANGWGRGAGAPHVITGSGLEVYRYIEIIKTA